MKVLLGKFKKTKFSTRLVYIVTSLIIVTIKLLTEKNAYVENPVTVLSYIKVLYSPVAGYFLWVMISST